MEFWVSSGLNIKNQLALTFKSFSIQFAKRIERCLFNFKTPGRLSNPDQLVLCFHKWTSLTKQITIVKSQCRIMWSLFLTHCLRILKFRSKFKIWNISNRLMWSRLQYIKHLMSRLGLTKVSKSVNETLDCDRPIRWISDYIKRLSVYQSSQSLRCWNHMRLWSLSLLFRSYNMII